jgi:hypothetical protein
MTELQTSRTVPATDSNSSPRDFKSGGGEEPGDSVIAPRAPQALGEKALVEAATAGGKSVDHAPAAGLRA